MTALFTIRTDDGRRRRCDESCYNAYGAHCTCVCGGRNHGVGVRRAAQQTVRHLARWVDDLAVTELLGQNPRAIPHHSLHAIAHPNLCKLDDTAGWRSYS